MVPLSPRTTFLIFRPGTYRSHSTLSTVPHTQRSRGSGGLHPMRARAGQGRQKWWNMRAGRQKACWWRACTDTVTSATPVRDTHVHSKSVTLPRTALTRHQRPGRHYSYKQSETRRRRGRLGGAVAKPALASDPELYKYTHTHAKRNSLWTGYVLLSLLQTAK